MIGRQGRLENDLKISKIINKRLENLPFYVTEWHDHMLAEEKTAATRKDYVKKIAKFLSEFKEDPGQVKIEDIKEYLVIRYFASLRTVEKNGEIKYTSDSYKQTVWSCLHNFFEFLYNAGYIEKNYMESIKRPKNRDLNRINNTRVLLTKEDFSKILDAVRHGAGSHRAREYQKSFMSRDLTMMMLFMTTGIRKTALSEINIEDVDLENKKLTIVDKGDIEQTYSLPEKLCREMERWMCIREIYANDNVNALFVTRYGERITGGSIEKLVKKYTKEALGVPLSPHKLRAGFCSILYKEKKDVEFVRRAVGHSDVSTTLRYITTDNKEREEAGEIIESFI